MFEQGREYPCAVTGGDDGGLQAGFDWCAEQMSDGDTLTLFVPLKSSLGNSDLLRGWADYRDVEVVTSRGTIFVRRGPVLAVWPHMDDLGKVARGSNRLTALCVAAWVDDWVKPWVAATGATVLADHDTWDDVAASTLPPVVEEAMKALTLAVNHNNTIAAGYEKDSVVSVLLLLSNAGYRLEPEPLQGWALAHGWTSGNPQQLAKYVRDINAGKRPKSRSMLRPDYLQTLQDRAGETA